MRRLLIVAVLALAAPPAALARGTFDPTKEFEQHEWIPIHLGPLNLSITKAVAYLMLGSLLTIVFGLVSGTFIRSSTVATDSASCERRLSGQREPPPVYTR